MNQSFKFRITKQFL